MDVSSDASESVVKRSVSIRVAFFCFRDEDVSNRPGNQAKMRVDVTYTTSLSLNIFCSRNYSLKN